MTKAKISEYDAVAANNTDVNGVNIAENCPPSGMNNMGREIMAALKRFQVGSDGDGVTVGGNLVVSGASTVAALNTSGAVVFNDAGADVDFRVEGDTDANLLFVDASADSVGIGTSSPGNYRLKTAGAGFAFFGDNYFNVGIHDGSASQRGVAFGYNSTSQTGIIAAETSSAASNLAFFTFGGVNWAEGMRLTSGGDLLVGKTTDAGATVGAQLEAVGIVAGTVGGGTGTVFYANRQNDDGILMQFAQASITEGSISVSGTTVSYNGGHLSRWAQTLSAKDESLKKGTVLSNLDEMNVYVKPTLYWTEEDELPVDEEGNPTVAVGDVKEETSVSDNEQLNKVKVSDVEGDPNVAGVFVNWTYDEAHQVDEINMVMTGDMIIRIAEGVTVARGDLLMSAGDGTAKPQGDDIVRSKTIAKVTSTHVTCTYEDGSYCVPCVLMAC